MYESGVIDILDPVNDEVLGQCCGPTNQGSCPAADPSGIVLCHGCTVAATNAGPEYWRLWVPDASRHCPGAWNLKVTGY
jgi:hypothetical protein